jgi:CubicO group peptidase (beta-lactamase class C family)
MNVADPKTLGISSERLKRLDEWLEKQITSDRLAGCSLLLARHGKIAYFNTTGHSELETNKPFQEDTIVRLYSMTKPITTVAAMMLYEENAFQLDDPIYRYIPAFREMQVWQGGSLDNTKAAERPITVRHLMTHTSGLTYGFMQANPVDERYRELRLESPSDAANIEEWVERAATVPLIAQPGSQWNYSIATDVLGRLVEIWSGETLAEYFENHIFQPLKMNDMAFHVAEEKKDRFAALYNPPSGSNMSSVGQAAVLFEEDKVKGLMLEDSAEKSRYLKPPTHYSGGGGLTGTMSDYSRFCQMLLNRGELDGTRLLGRKVVEYMMQNHLPDNKDMAAMNQPVWSETTAEGIGFGLGGAVMIDPVKAQVVSSAGEFNWGGAASTVFWIDPKEDLYTIFLTQLKPSSTYPIRRELRVRIYQTLTD